MGRQLIERSVSIVYGDAKPSVGVTEEGQEEFVQGKGAKPERRLPRQ
jgi:hypothetical protein